MRFFLLHLHFLLPLQSFLVFSSTSDLQVYTHSQLSRRHLKVKVGLIHNYTGTKYKSWNNQDDVHYIACLNIWGLINLADQPQTTKLAPQNNWSLIPSKCSQVLFWPGLILCLLSNLLWTSVTTLAKLVWIIQIQAHTKDWDRIREKKIHGLDVCALIQMRNQLLSRVQDHTLWDTLWLTASICLWFMFNHFCITFRTNQVQIFSLFSYPGLFCFHYEFNFPNLAS